MALFASLPGGEVCAQDLRDSDVRYTYVFSGVSLPQALERLISDTRLSVIYDSDLVAGRKSFCRATEVGAEELLACVLRRTGLTYARLESGTFLLLPDPELPARTGNIAGQVVDFVTGVPLADASVVLIADNSGTATNSDGRFAFASLLPGPHPVAISHVAYHRQVDTLEVTPGGKMYVSIPLRPRTVLTEPIIIRDFAGRLRSDDLESSSAYSPEEGDHEIGVSSNVLSDIGSVVGVRLGDVLSDVHVQGGAANEQPVLLDDMPIFVPVANGGFVGPFSPFGTGTVTIRKAGFGARFGDGMSGVVAVDQWLPARTPASMAVQIDPISISGRVAGGAGSTERLSMRWMIAARKGLWDLFAPDRISDQITQWASPDRFLIRALLQDDGQAPVEPGYGTGTPELDFDDLHVATSLRLRGLRSLQLSLYRGSNTFGVGDLRQPGREDIFEEAYRWKNKAYRVRYEWVQSSRLFLNAGAWMSRYELSHPVSLSNAGVPEIDISSPGSTDFNELAQFGARLGADLAVGSRHFVSGAVETLRSRSEMAMNLDPLGGQPDLRTTTQWRVAGFVEDRVSLSRFTALTVGARMTVLSGGLATYVEPRISVQNDRPVGRSSLVTLRGAVGVYRQYLHSFDLATYNVTALFPRVRYWIPVAEGQRPPVSYHASIVCLYSTASGWEAGVGTFYKNQPRVLRLKYGVTNEATTEELFSDASAYALGATSSVGWNSERLHLNAVYEWSRTRLRVPGRFRDARVPAPWDAPHHLRVSIDLRLLQHITATVRWQAVLGRSWAFRQGYYEYLEPVQSTRLVGTYDLSDPGAHHPGPISQLDAGLSYAARFRGIGLQGRVSLVNVLDRRNVMDWSVEGDEESGFAVIPRYMIPFIPSASLRLSL